MSSYLSVRNAGSCLSLEVISGPSCGVRCSVQSTNPSHLPLTMGRVSPSNLLIKDSEVSGKHALINWNVDVNLFLFNFIWIWILEDVCYIIVGWLLISEIEMGVDGYG